MRSSLQVGRIEKFYLWRLRWLLSLLNAREASRGVACLTATARELAKTTQVPLALAYARAHNALHRRVLAHLRRRRKAGGTLPPGLAPLYFQSVEFPEFFCDAGLGGLTRWLRAAGYRAEWNPALDDAGVVREADRRGAILLTTDSLMMERGVLRDGIVPALWLPPTLTTEEQLALALDAWALPVREESRCMACGGRLLDVEKKIVADRIPPKTLLWRDDYYVCENCGKLFWHGSHWEKIRETLAASAGGGSPSALD